MCVELDTILETTRKGVNTSYTLHFPTILETLAVGLPARKQNKTKQNKTPTSLSIYCENWVFPKLIPQLAHSSSLLKTHSYTHLFNYSSAFLL